MAERLTDERRRAIAAAVRARGDKSYRLVAEEQNVSLATLMRIAKDRSRAKRKDAPDATAAAPAPLRKSAKKQRRSKAVVESNGDAVTQRRNGAAPSLFDRIERLEGAVERLLDVLLGERL